MATRKGLFRTITIPAPKSLLNTSVSKQALTGQFAFDIENMLPPQGKSTSLAKRYGTSQMGNAIGAGTITHNIPFVKADGTQQFLVYTNDGKLHLTEDDGASWSEEKSGLDTTGSIRHTFFNNKVIIVNGKDTPMSWDGSTLATLEEYVEDALASNYTQVDTNTITIDPGTGRTDTDYPAGRTIRVTFDTAGAVTATVDTTSYSAPTLTINVTGNPFPSPTETITKVEYIDNPPPFSFIFAQHDRLWGLEEGELKASTYKASDRMEVYYLDGTNNENAWFNSTTQEVGRINIEDKNVVQDELVGISALDGLMVFHGRNRLQVWSGTNPTAGGDFSWAKTVPVGTVHGDLIQDFPRDVVFASPYGIRSMRNVFQTEQLEVQTDIGSNIDPTVQSDITTLTASDAAYKTAYSFFYERDGFYGFKIGSKVLVYVLNEESRGWTKFSGQFSNANHVTESQDGRLILAQGDKLYVYRNGADGQSNLYGDNGENIRTAWESPWAEGSGRWPNRKWLFLIEPGTAEATMLFKRKKDNNAVLDTVYSKTVGSTIAFWDEALWDVDLWDTAFFRPELRDKFIGESFSFRLETNNTTGPFEIVGVQAIGG